MTEGVESGGITQDGCAVLPTEKQEGAAGGVRPATSRRVYRPPELVRMRKTVGVACAGEIREGGRCTVELGGAAPGPRTGARGARARERARLRSACAAEFGVGCWADRRTEMTKNVETLFVRLRVFESVLSRHGHARTALGEPERGPAVSFYDYGLRGWFGGHKYGTARRGERRGAADGPCALMVASESSKPSARSAGFAVRLPEVARVHIAKVAVQPW